MLAFSSIFVTKAYQLENFLSF